MINHLNANRVQHLMRAHKVTIRGLALQMGITQKRVRQVRAQGVRGHLLVCDWYQGITGRDIYQRPHAA
jgi:hypothetical protein